jgi:hypothetical protein
MNSFDLLVSKATEEQFDELWFSYSGHGSYVYDETGDEKDYYDEVICPVDYSSSGMIVDDYIYDNLVSKLPSNATLFALMDCCHSGTILDLPYMYNNSVETNNNTVISTTNNNKNHPATVISISGCKDDQTSADAYISKYQGAMTWSFLNALSNVNYNVRLSDLVHRMRVLLSNDNYTQVPMLATSSPSDIDKYFIHSGDENVVSQKSKPVQFRMKVDYWFEESTWNVFSVNSDEYVFSNDNSFSQKYQENEITIDLSPGTYKLIVKDTYGDGGVSSTIVCGLIVLLSSNMTMGRYAEYTFTV